MGAGALPGNLVLEVLRAEEAVQNQLEIVARRGVTVEVQAACGL